MKKYILFILMAVISMAAAVFVTKWLKKESTPTISPPSPEPITVEEIMDPTPVKPIELRLVKLEKTGTNQFYLEVQADNLPEGISVKYKIRELKKVHPNTDGCFTSLPGNKAGRYTVELLDALADTLLAEQSFEGFNHEDSQQDPVKSITSAELKSLILSGNTSDPRISKSLNIKVFGLKDDRKPDDLQMIYDKVANGIWTSFKIFDESTEYDSRGRVSSITIQPVYPEE